MSKSIDQLRHIQEMKQSKSFVPPSEPKLEFNPTPAPKISAAKIEKEAWSIKLSAPQLIFCCLINVIAVSLVYPLGVYNERQAHRPVLQPSPVTSSPLMRQTPAEVPPAREFSAPLPAPESSPVVAAKEVSSPASEEKSETPVLTAETAKQDLALSDSNQELIRNYFTLQLAVYKKEKFAQKEANRLLQQGYDAIVLPNGKFYTLCLHKFSQKNEAEERLGELRSTGFLKIYKGAFVHFVK